MKKINNIILIQDDDADCLVNKHLVQEMQLADQIHCLDDEQQALTFISECCTAITKSRNNQIALIFLDLSLPFLNVYDFLDQLGKTPGIVPENIFLVLLTNSWDLNDIEKAKHYHINGYLNKPLTPEKVQDIIVSLQDRRVA